jgi:hypothetical protein
MKKAFVITSLIDVDNQSPLTYVPFRSCFSTEERLRQTIFTVTSLDHVSDSETTIFLLDCSENWQNYRDMFQYQKNLIYVSAKDCLPEIYQEVRTHPNKSRGECLLLSSFLTKFEHLLKNYDYIFKISGRYFLDSSCNFDLLTQENLDKIFFKKEQGWDWQDRWQYSMIDLRSVQGDNNLYCYHTIVFGWGKDQYLTMLSLLDTVANFLSDQTHFHYDIETLSYFYTRPYKQNIVNFDWTIYGFDGAHGTFKRI